MMKFLVIWRKVGLLRGAFSPILCACLLLIGCTLDRAAVMQSLNAFIGATPGQQVGGVRYTHSLEGLGPEWTPLRPTIPDMTRFGYGPLGNPVVSNGNAGQDNGMTQRARAGPPSIQQGLESSRVLDIGNVFNVYRVMRHREYDIKIMLASTPVSVLSNYLQVQGYTTGEDSLWSATLANYSKEFARSNTEGAAIDTRQIRTLGGDQGVIDVLTYKTEGGAQGMLFGWVDQGTVNLALYEVGEDNVPPAVISQTLKQFYGIFHALAGPG